MNRERVPGAETGSGVRFESRFSRELLGRIQEELLGADVPECWSDLEVATLVAPFQEVGGDFVEFFDGPPGCPSLVLGDVMGKGAPAALVAESIKLSFVKEHNRSGGLEEGAANFVERVGRRVNHKLVALAHLVTACYLRLDLERGIASVVDCGHPPILHYRARERRVVTLKGHRHPGFNLPLGVELEAHYEEETVHFEPEDVFLLFTDGFCDAVDAEERLLGIERMRSLMERNPLLPARLLVYKLRLEAERHAGLFGLQDDLTCVAIRVPGPADRHPSPSLPPTARPRKGVRS